MVDLKGYTMVFWAWLVKSHVPHFLDKSMGKLMGHGSRAFVFSATQFGPNNKHMIFHGLSLL